MTFGCNLSMCICEIFMLSLSIGDTMDVFDAAERYRSEGKPLIILAGKDYGSGSSRDWAAKGPWILVSCVCVCVITVFQTTF